MKNKQFFKTPPIDFNDDDYVRYATYYTSGGRKAWSFYDSEPIEAENINAAYHIYQKRELDKQS